MEPFKIALLYLFVVAVGFHPSNAQCSDWGTVFSGGKCRRQFDEKGTEADNLSRDERGFSTEDQPGKSMDDKLYFMRKRFGNRDIKKDVLV